MQSTVLTATGLDLQMPRSSRIQQNTQTTCQMEVSGIIQLTGQLDRAHVITATIIRTIIQQQLAELAISLRTREIPGKDN